MKQLAEVRVTIPAAKRRVLHRQREERVRLPVAQRTRCDNKRAQCDMDSPQTRASQQSPLWVKAIRARTPTSPYLRRQYTARYKFPERFSTEGLNLKQLR